VPGTIDLITPFTLTHPWYIGKAEFLNCNATNFTSLSHIHFKFESSSGDVVLTGCNGTSSYHQGSPGNYGIPPLFDSDCASAFNKQGFSIQLNVIGVASLRNGTLTCVGVETELGYLQVNSPSTTIQLKGLLSLGEQIELLLIAPLLILYCSSFLLKWFLCPKSCDHNFLFC